MHVSPAVELLVKQRFKRQDNLFVQI